MPPARAARLDVDAFTFSWQPERIVVGETAAAVVRIVAVDDAGAPLDRAPPTLVTSTGSVDAPVREGPGVWTARFTPPRAAFPHVAIISAVIDSGVESAVGFVTLPLWGRGQTTVQTKPGSAVTVHVGDAAFGPVVADDSGDVVVDILVPPGPEHAVATSVDASGNETTKSIDLGVPGFNRLAAVALDDVVVGDGSGDVHVLAFAVDRKGAPLATANIGGRASAGSLVAGAVPVAPGIFEVAWEPGSVPAQTATITLQLADAPLSTATTSIQVIAGAPVRAELVTPRRVLSADDDPAVVVDVRVLDAGDNLVPFGAARVDVDVGRIDSARPAPIEAGARQLVWVLPRARRPTAPGVDDVATLSVRSHDGRVLGRTQLELLPGAPSSLTIAPIEPVVADGSAGVAVVVTAVDAWGNALTPAGLEVSAVDGVFVGRTVDPIARRFEALYVPEARDDEGVVDVTARFGRLTTSERVRLRPRPRPLLLVGPAIGSVGSGGIDVVAVGPELSMLVRLPVLDGALHAGVNLGALVAVPPLSTTAFERHTAYPLLGELAWRPLLLPSLGLHVGVDVGLVVVDSAVPTTAGLLRAIEPGIAGAVVVGLAWRAGPGFIELDARLGHGVLLGTPVVDVAPYGSGVVLAYRFGL